MSKERLLARQVNASNHLSGLDSHLVVTREDLEQIHRHIVGRSYISALRLLEKILDGEKGERASVEKAEDPKLCGIPSYNVGSCDLPVGHEGEMHSNAGDGFYARDYEGAHQAAQQAAKKKGRSQQP